MYAEPSTELSTLQHEWITLQNQFDNYEKFALMIKLLAVVICALAVLTERSGIWVFLIVAILWLQDAIWKTFQGRMFARLLVVEKALSEEQSDKGMQFNSSWQESRSDYVSLLREYLKAACKPTVAYPYMVLLLCLMLF